MKGSPVPRRLIAGLFGVAVASLAAGIYLELEHAAVLVAHPYLVNLLSGITSFAAGGLTLSLVVDRMVAASRRRRWSAVVSRLRISLLSCLPRLGLAICILYGVDRTLLSGNQTIGLVETRPDGSMRKVGQLMLPGQYEGLNGLSQLALTLRERLYLIGTVGADVATLLSREDAEPAQSIQRQYELLRNGRVGAAATQRAVIDRQVRHLIAGLLPRMIAATEDKVLATKARDIEDCQAEWRSAAHETVRYKGRELSPPDAATQLLDGLVRTGPGMAGATRSDTAPAADIIAALAEEMRTVYNLVVAMLELGLYLVEELDGLPLVTSSWS